MISRPLARLVSALLFGWFAPSLVHASSLEFFDASAGPMNTLVIEGPTAATLVDLDYDGESAEGGITFGWALDLQTTGDVVIEAIVCQDIGCSFDPSAGPFTMTSGSGGDDFDGETGIVNLALLTISGSNGSLLITGGSYTNGDFDLVPVDPFTLATISTVPEPSMLLMLGVGFAALALSRGRR